MFLEDAVEVKNVIKNNLVFGTHLFRYAKATDVCDRYYTMYAKRHETRLQREDVELQELKRRKRRHQALGAW